MMKFSLHVRNVSADYLAKAEEIVIEYRDREIIPEYAEKYPDAQLVLDVPTDTRWNFNEIKEYFILSKNKLTICLPDMWDENLPLLIKNQIPFFWSYTIKTFWELHAMINIGASQVRIGAPLFFQCDKLKSFNIEKRICPNIAHEGYLPGVDGIVGSWIRPEDLCEYEEVFDTVEFADCGQNHKEEALYRIYAEQKVWPSQLNMIISNIDSEAYNRMIRNEFIIARKNCGQRCLSGGACRICHRALHLANPELIHDYLKRTGQEEDKGKDMPTSQFEENLIEEEKHS